MPGTGATAGNETDKVSAIGGLVSPRGSWGGAGPNKCAHKEKILGNFTHLKVLR